MNDNRCTGSIKTGRFGRGRSDTVFIQSRWQEEGQARGAI